MFSCRHAAESFLGFIFYFFLLMHRTETGRQRESESHKTEGKKCFECFLKVPVKQGFKDLFISHSGCITQTLYWFTAQCRWQCNTAKGDQIGNSIPRARQMNSFQRYALKHNVKSFSLKLKWFSSQIGTFWRMGGSIMRNVECPSHW